MAAFLLIHGGQHGSWCWEKVKKELETRGHRVVAPDLPGNGADDTPLKDVTLDLYAEFVAKELDRFDDKVVLVGHSIGGLTISAAAELRPKAIKRLVYIAAILPQTGQSSIDTRSSEAEAPPTRRILISDDGLTASLEPENVRSYFYSDCSDEDAAWATARLTPQPLSPMKAAVKLSDEKFGSVPRAYVICTKDQLVDPARQRMMIAATPCELVAEVPRGHSPFLSAPAELADVLERFADA